MEEQALKKAFSLIKGEFDKVRDEAFSGNYEDLENVPVVLTGGSQTKESTESGGVNEFTFTKSDGTTGTFIVRNGLKGDSGDSFQIVKTYSSVAEMNNNFSSSDVKEGQFVLIASSVEEEDNAKLYVKGKSSFVFMADLSGAQGVKGEQGVSITSITTQTSEVNGGTNTVTIALSDGTSSTFNIKNGIIQVDSALNTISTNPVQNKIITTQLNLKAPKDNPVFTGSISMGRKSNSNIGNNSIAIGNNVAASGAASYSEGIDTEASAEASHAEGKGTIAAGEAQHVQGKYNIEDTENKYVHIVGWGDGIEGSPDERKNIHTLDTDGNAMFAGDVVATDADGNTISVSEMKDYVDTLEGKTEDVIDTAISTHNVNTEAHNDIRVLVKELTTRLNAVADSEVVDLDQLSEIVAYIQSNRSLIDTITTSKVSITDIVDNLTTNVANKPLSAAQGVVIKSLIDALNTAVVDKANTSDLTSHTGNTTVHITSTERTNWNDANTKKHEHSNKSVLDGITSSLVSSWNTVTGKVDKVEGKGLSTNDYTNEEKEKLASLFVDGKVVADTAVKLETARTISMDTAVSSTATSFDGSSNITIPVTEVKEAYLSWGGKDFAGGFSPLDTALIDELGANRLAFTNGDNIIVEYSRDGGATWVDYGISKERKTQLVTTGDDVRIGARGSAGTATAKDKLRITINGAQTYCQAKKLAILLSTAGAEGCTCTIEKSSYGAKTTFTTVKTVSVSGWSGWNIIQLSNTFGNSTYADAYAYRLTFGCTSVNNSYIPLQVYKIRMYSSNSWNTPSVMASNGHLYSYDVNQNATFPNKVTATGGFTGNLTGTADTAKTLTGLTSTVTELNYVDGVTSNIQTQLNAKSDSLTDAEVEAIWNEVFN